MIKRSFKLHFKFGILIPILRQQIEELFNEVKFFSNWDYEGEENFAAKITTNQRFPSLDLNYQKLALHLYGEKKEERIDTLHGGLFFHTTDTIETNKANVRKFERLLEKKIKKAAEKSRPSVKLLTPQKESTVVGKQDIKAKIDGMNIKTIQIYLNNTLLNEASSKGIKYTLDSTKFQDGTKELTIVAIDKEGRELSHTTSLKISNTPPKLLIKGIRDEGVVKGDVLVGLLSKGGEISEIEVKIDNELRESKTLDTPKKKVKKAYHWNTIKFKDGWHRITFTVKTQTGQMNSKTKTVLSLNPKQKEKPRRRLIRKGRFYNEILETIKALISPHFGGILSVNEATMIFNRVFDLEEEIKRREIIKAVNQSNNNEIRWISPGHLIEVIEQRKVADNWLKEKIFNFAWENTKKGSGGFTTAEVTAFIKSEQKGNGKNMKKRYIKERVKRTLADLKAEGQILHEEYPPSWFIPSPTEKRNGASKN